MDEHKGLAWQANQAFFSARPPVVALTPATARGHDFWLGPSLCQPVLLSSVWSVDLPSKGCGWVHSSFACRQLCSSCSDQCNTLGMVARALDSSPAIRQT